MESGDVQTVICAVCLTSRAQHGLNQLLNVTVSTTVASISDATLMRVGVDPREGNHEALFFLFGLDDRTEELLEREIACFHCLPFSHGLSGVREKNLTANGCEIRFKARTSS